MRKAVIQHLCGAIFMSVKLQFEKVPDRQQLHFFSKKRVEESFNFHWHFHPEFELTLIVSGQGIRIIGDNISNYDPGDLVLVGPNLPHTWFSTAANIRLPQNTAMSQNPDLNNTGSEAIIIQFNLDTILTLLPASVETGHVSNLLKRAAVGISFEGEKKDQIASRMQALESKQGIPRMIEFLEILDTLGNYNSNECSELSSRVFVEEIETFDYDRINKVCNYLNQHFTEQITESDAARFANLGVWSFSRIFHNNTGKTFKAYLSDLRIGWACRLLIETELPVARIALDSGFNNLSNFNRQFRNLKKVSPRVYRQQRHQQPILKSNSQGEASCQK